MSHTTNESDDIVFSKDQIESSLAEDSCGGSGNGGIVLKKGPWTSAEDAILIEYVKKHGEGNWNAVQKHSGLSRCGKSCRLRWANHLRPNLKKGAFTQEEEQLIIELHAKMGNKWARMAAHLPGRTDNEIKNYWNTRIKRRQRAGLPLYPPEVSLQALNGNQRGLNMGGINTGDEGHHHDLLSCEIPDVIFNYFKANHGIISPYAPELPGITHSSMLLKGSGASQCGSFISPVMHRQKRLRESTTLLAGYSGSLKDGLPLFEQFQDGSSFQFESDPGNKNMQLSFGENQDSHAIANGNFSTSKPRCGPVKLELPSLQYPENDLCSWGTPPPHLPQNVDAFIQSPPHAGTVARNSGLLDALLYEAKTLSSAKNHSSDKSSNSSTVTPAETSTLNVCDTEWEEYAATSLFSECTPISASGSSLEEAHPADIFPVCNVKSEVCDQAWSPEREEESNIQVDSSRPDALLDANWLGEQGCGYIKDEAFMTDNIATLLGDDLSSEYKQMSAGASAPNQGWGLGSCAWNAMPAVCQMSQLP